MKYAYVNMLFGDNIYYIGTLIFAISLYNTKPKYDMILLHTNDVPKYKLDLLKPYYKDIIEINYIPVKTKRERFKNVFTKLKIFSLYKYDKVLFMDNDMIVLKNIDHLFEYNTPAGMALSPELKYKDREEVADENVVFNAGLWLIKPNKGTYIKMMNGIKKFNTKKELEQEYVSYFYNKRWTNISYLYNFQPGLIEYDDVRGRIYKKCKLSDVYVIHYSSTKKPWNILENNKHDYYNKYNIYYNVWLKLFIKTAKQFCREKNINIFKLDNIIKDTDKYLDFKYSPNRVLLNIEQQYNLFKKLNTKIPTTKYTYLDVIKKIIDKRNTVYLYGGILKSLLNNENIKNKDIDLLYTISPDLVENKFKKMKDLIYIRGNNYNKYFRVGCIDNSEIDMFYIDRVDTIKNSTINSLVLNIKKMEVIDITNQGLQDLKNKIWKKNNNISYDQWLCAKTPIIFYRLIKFHIEGFNTIKNDRKMIYNYIYNYDYYKSDEFKKLIKYLKKVKNIKEVFKFIKHDIDNSDLKFTGNQFINYMKKFILF
jgi:inositol 3-alpha-galactosyltransferase